MILDFDLSQNFKNYGKLKAIQVDNKHIQEISNIHDGGEIIIKLDNVRLLYNFIYVNNGRYFTELCLLDGFNRILAVAYKDDYIVKDKTRIYVLNKKIFEEKFFG